MPDREPVETRVGPSVCICVCIQYEASLIPLHGVSAHVALVPVQAHVCVRCSYTLVRALPLPSPFLDKKTAVDTTRDWCYKLLEPALTPHLLYQYPYPYLIHVFFRPDSDTVL